MRKFLLRVLISLTFALLLATAGVFLFADALLKKAIENTGSLIAEAKVEVADAHLTLSPLGISLSDLQIADATSPMSNTIQIRRIAFAVQGKSLFKRQFICTEMDASGVRFNTPRTTSGALHPKDPLPQPPKKRDLIQLPSLDFKDPKEILAQETLRSVEEARRIQANIKAAEKRYKAHMESLPDDETFKGYEKRLRSLKNGKLDLSAFFSKADELKKITKEVKADLKKIEAFRKELKNDLLAFTNRLKTLPELTQSDYKRLKKKYTLDSQGLGQVTDLLLGEAWKNRLEKGTHLYRKLRPLLSPPPQKNSQENLPVEAKKPWVVWIQRGHFEVEAKVGDIRGTLSDLTTSQNATNHPTRIHLSADQLDGVDSMRLKGFFYHKGVDTLTVTAEGVKLGPYGGQSLKLKRTTADLYGKVLITPNHRLDAHLKALIKNVRITSTSTSFKPLKKALNEINTLSVLATAKGPLESYQLTLSSNLDTLLKQLFENSTQQLQTEFEKRLQATIKKEADGHIASVQRDLKELSGLGKQIEALIQKNRKLF
ncbi:MAG: TIGR03545 family protein [Desulfobacterales bacterium]|nr:TIGR03545 family protein [Desulfobacterales bacterium]